MLDTQHAPPVLVCAPFTQGAGKELLCYAITTVGKGGSARPVGAFARVISGF